MSVVRCLVALFVVCVALPAAHARPKPAFLLDSMLDQIYFDDESGLIRFSDMNLAFAPEDGLNASVVVVNAENTVVQRFEFFPDYRLHDGVFATAMVRGPAEVTLTEPGVYNIVCLVDGEMATRLPVVLEQVSEGDDPFDPVKKYEFFGLWRTYGYLTIDENDAGKFPKLSFWAGGRDLAEGEQSDRFRVVLKRDGEVVAHSRHTQGHIAKGHYKRVEITIHKPHEERDVTNAPRSPLSDWTQDGEYELLVTRNSDGRLIRRFRFTAKDGEIEELPNTKLGYEPRIDYIVPRVPVRGVTTFRLESAIWIRSD
ncbi:MAG: hypothetical protein JJU33_14825 [Phycisphaerales bacterium]|nr:hypothetical protein [Phycisphaerales bacterium]